MKLRLKLTLVLLLGVAMTSTVFGQDSPTDPAEAAADLRLRLLELQTREADLQARLSQLDEALQPENIARSMSGIGSTRPEELREQRRRELTIETDSVRRQLEVLAGSRVRLESAIQAADNRAYQQSAMGFAGNAVSAERMPAFNPRWVLIPLVCIVALLVSGCMVACIRRP